MDEFRTGVPGSKTFNLNNLWTYFWRWSAWKAFEANEPAGIVALITPSPYLTSASYAGMRQNLRQTADEGWIIDLSPEQHRPDGRTRIFPTTQHAICIINDSEWADCSTDWDSPLRPKKTWQEYPAIGDLFPWHNSGVTSNRNWVWAPDQETLERRWAALSSATSEEIQEMFKETQSRTVESTVSPIPGSMVNVETIAFTRNTMPPITPISFHAFDRQSLIFNARVIDRPRNELWQTVGPAQIFINEQHAHPIEDGPGLVFSTLVPNVHNFNGRGGRVLPLYRDGDGDGDGDGAEPNLPPRLHKELEAQLNKKITPNDIVSYTAGIVSHPWHTRRFRGDLKNLGIRIPVTTDNELWSEAVDLGRRLIWLRTFGERFVDDQQNRPQSLGTSRRAEYVVPVSGGNSHLPTKVDHQNETLIIGEDTLLSEAGRVEPVSRAVWEYRVGSVQVIKKWFSYRHPDPPRRKRTSSLDDINPYRWCSEFDDELLDLIEVLNECVLLEPAQDDLLTRICMGPLLSTSTLKQQGVLPAPTQFSKPPRLDRGLLP